VTARRRGHRRGRARHDRRCDRRERRRVRAPVWLDVETPLRRSRIGRWRNWCTRKSTCAAGA